MDNDNKDHLAAVLEDHKKDILTEVEKMLLGYYTVKQSQNNLRMLSDTLDEKLSYNSRAIQDAKQTFEHVLKTDEYHYNLEKDQLKKDILQELNATIDAKFISLQERIDEIEDDYEEESNEIESNELIESRQTLESYLKNTSLREEEAIKLVSKLSDEINMKHLKHQVYNHLNPTRILIEQTRNGIEFALDENVPVRRINCKYLLSDDMDANFDYYPTRKERSMNLSDDTYALASILHYTITKHPPERSEFESKFDPDQFEGKLSSDVINFLKDALSQNEQDRFQDMKSFKSSLDSLNGSGRYYTKDHNRRIVEAKTKNWGLVKRSIYAPAIALAQTARDFLPMIIRNNPKKSTAVGTGLIVASLGAYGWMFPAKPVVQAVASTAVVQTTRAATDIITKVPRPRLNYNFDFAKPIPFDTNKWVLDRAPSQNLFTPKPPYQVNLPNKNYWIGTETVDGKTLKYFFVRDQP